MVKKYILSLGVTFVLCLLAFCSGFRKIQRSGDWQVKYDAAMDYYNKKDYYRSSILFEEILPLVRGLPEGEKTEFYLAYCQYYEKTYLLASSQFKTFYETYGRSTLVEEANFMHAYSLYVSSPDSNLDQKNSVEAMESLQSYLNRYPDGQFSKQAIEAIQAIQQKLEEKGFANAQQYFKIRSYKASIIAFDNFKQSFPDSKYIEEAIYLKVVAQYKLAKASFQSLQFDRYNTVISYYIELIDNYPNSIYLKNVQAIYSSSLDTINKFKKNKNS